MVTNIIIWLTVYMIGAVLSAKLAYKTYNYSGVCRCIKCVRMKKIVSILFASISWLGLMILLIAIVMSKREEVKNGY